MNCIRCGKETEENQVFCCSCLTDMERHPVKPGTPIQLPNRIKRSSAKRTGFKLAASKWQDRIFRLKYIIFWLVVVIFLLAAALTVCVLLLTGTAPQWLNDLLYDDASLRLLIEKLKP